MRPASVPATVTTPPVLEERPCVTPNPLLTSGVGSAAAAREESTSSSGPVAAPVQDPPSKPPRSRSKRLKMKKQFMEEEKEVEVADLHPPSPLPASTKPTRSLSPKPAPPHPSPVWPPVTPQRLNSVSPCYLPTPHPNGSETIGKVSSTQITPSTSTPPTKSPPSPIHCAHRYSLHLVPSVTFLLLQAPAP